MDPKSALGGPKLISRTRLKVSLRDSESFLVLHFPWSGSSRLRVGGVTVALQIKSG